MSCRGILRDEKGITRAIFSGSRVARDANSAENEAIITALDITCTIGGKCLGSIIVEVGSREVFKWLKERFETLIVAVKVYRYR